MLFLAWLFIFPKNCIAGNAPVIINEVMYNPSGGDNNSTDSKTYEWIELKNISFESQNISSWILRAGTYYALSAITSPIPPSGFVIVHEGIGTNKNTDFSDGDTAYLYMNKTGSQLGDSYDDVSLYNATTKSKDTIVDYVDYALRAPSSASSCANSFACSIALLARA